MDFSEKVQWLGDLGIVFSLPEDISSLLFLRKRFYLFIFREGNGGREGEKHQCVVAFGAPPTGDLAYNPGVCPDWELNQQTLWCADWHSIH